MAHEIITTGASADTVVLGSNTVAWHGLGKLFAGLLSPLRAFAEGVGARDIIEENVVVNGATFASHKALFGVNEAGQRYPLSIVGRRYGVLKDLSFFQILENVYGGNAVVETAGTLRGGRRVWALAKHDSFEVGLGDQIETYDLWLNTHDGSSCFELHRTNVRVVCANTWAQAVGGGKARVLGVPHRTNVEANAKAAIAQLQRANESAAHARAEVQRLAATAISKDAAVDVFSKLLDINPDEAVTPKVQKSLDTLVELFVRGTGTEGKSRWDAFNAVTEFVDHRRTLRVGEGRSRAEARFESALLGDGDALKATAYDLLVTV